jgi:nucleoside-diphosphate-sugar epimerase
VRALIIGGNGAIGSAIARHADAAGMETHVGVRASCDADRLSQHPLIRRHPLDITDPSSVERLLRALHPDWIVMAAFPRAGHAPDPESRRTLLLGMCEGLLGLLEGARAAGFQEPMTWIGSAMAYGGGQVPLRAAEAALRPRTFRGAVKAAEGLLAASVAAQFGIALTQIRVFTGYGPYEQRERFVSTLLRAGLTDGRVRVAQRPGQRDWIHYDDIARACLAVAARREAGIFNACTGRLHDTHSVASLLEGIIGKPLLAHDPYPQEDPYGDVAPGVVPDPLDGLDWTPRIGLAEGLERSWDWARSAHGRAYLLAGSGA